MKDDVRVDPLIRFELITPSLSWMCDSQKTRYLPRILAFYHKNRLIIWNDWISYRIKRFYINTVKLITTFVFWRSCYELKRAKNRYLKTVYILIIILLLLEDTFSIPSWSLTCNIFKCNIKLRGCREP